MPLGSSNMSGVHLTVCVDFGESVSSQKFGAKRRLAKLLADHPGLVAYHQTDCRGCNLYLLHADQVAAGESVESVYNRGVAVCY